MNKKKIIIFAVCLSVLLALQIKYLLPFVYDIVASDLFLVDSKDEANSMPIHNDMTSLAFAHCNSHIKSKADDDQNLNFAGQPTNVWSLGNYEYVVNADVEISGKDTPAALRHYVCRIQYEKGDDTSGAADLENWSVNGVGGLEN